MGLSVLLCDERQLEVDGQGAAFGGAFAGHLQKPDDAVGILGLYH